MPILTLTGVVTDSQFQQARCLALELGRKKKTVKVEVVELGQMQWLEWIEKERKEMRGKGRTHNATCLAMHSVEGYLGGAKDFIEWCQEAYDMAPTVDIKAAEKKAEERFKGYMEKTGNTFVYMDLKFGDSEETERMIFELNVKQTPKTSGNFLKLCCGDSKAEGKGCRLHYKDTPIHRVVRGGWFQGGDVKDGSGMGGASIYGVPMFFFLHLCQPIVNHSYSPQISHSLSPSLSFSLSLSLSLLLSPLFLISFIHLSGFLSRFFITMLLSTVISSLSPFSHYLITNSLPPFGRKLR
ncbi:hypothetical protein AAMO2058_000971300 [Amorphochlora amoebiformis]